MKEKKQIRFTDSMGNLLFLIPDGGVLRMCYGNGDNFYACCRYLDETNIEIDGIRYSIRDFAKRMERSQINYAPA